MPEYCLKEYVSPIWQGSVMRYETVLFVGEEDETSLLYTPKKILAVYDYGLQKEYAAGKDYALKNGKLKRLKGGELPYIPLETYYAKSYETVAIRVNENALPAGVTAPRFFAFGEEDTFSKFEIAVCYTYDESENIPAPKGKSDRFARFLKKCEQGEDVTLLFYGDSITTGCNSSGVSAGGNVSPYAEIFPVMVQKTLAGRYGVNVKLINTAVGGWNVQQGLEAAEERVSAYIADLFVLAFGMNNGSTPPEEFRETTEKIVLRYREKNPDGEVLLVSTTLPNVDSDWLNNQPLFANELYKLEEKHPFVSVADMTAMHKTLMNKKRWRDMTGNNVNHPNDFLARVYAQVILQTVSG